MGGRRSYDAIPAPLVREEISKPFLCVLKVTVWIENVVGRVRIERRYSIFTISGVELERERQTDTQRENCQNES